MTDLILYVPDYAAFAEYISARHPDMLARDAENQLISPPEITGVARTPAVVSGQALMVYVRMSEEQLLVWRDTDVVEVLAETSFAGEGTALTLIESIEADEDKLAKYESVYPRGYVTQKDEFDVEHTSRPPRLFGSLMGAGGAPWPESE